MPPRLGIKFFIDHNVPESVAAALEAHGYAVVRLRTEIPEDAPDPLVAAVSEQSGAVLISLDGDFNKIAPRISIGRRRFMKLSRIWLTCAPPRSAARLEKVLPFVESEWRLSRKASDKRMILRIGDSYIRSER